MNSDLVLAIDVGNTQTVFGMFINGALAWTIRTRTDTDRPVDDLHAWLARELSDRDIDPARIGITAMASVVPQANTIVVEAILRLTGKTPVVADRTTADIELAVNHPERVGTDRLINAIAAANRYPCPVIVIDLGTATTISVVDRQGRFAGGTISPGLQTAANALHRATAQLPVIDIPALAVQANQSTLDIPVIGTDTAGCIRSGLIQGTAAMIEGLIDRIEENLGEPASRVITGGLAGLIRPECRRTLHAEPFLLLNGLYELGIKTLNEKAAGQSAGTSGQGNAAPAAAGIGRIGMVGAGRVGVTLGAYLISKGLRIAGYSSKSEHSAAHAAKITGSRHFHDLAELAANSDCLLLTVPDDQIGTAWNLLKPYCRPGQWVIHSSGSAGSSVLAGSDAIGVKTASMHPMFAFTRRDGSFSGLEDVCFSLEGDPEVTGAWRNFFHQYGHPVLLLDTGQKNQVHLASVIVANLGMALTSIGCQTLRQLGLAEEEACKAVLPLLQSNVANLRLLGLPDAITGPVDRNDLGTVSRHMAIMPADQLPIYRMLSRQLLQLARQKHPERDYKQLDQLLADPTD